MIGRLFQGRANIDTFMFKLHYVFTTTILLAFFLLFIVINLFGNPIQCSGGGGGLRVEMANSYCWSQSIYLVKQDPSIGSSVRHPAIAISSFLNNPENEERIYYNYYQWVHFVLFLQAIMFYAPHWLWSNWEGGKVASASQDLQGVAMQKDERRDRIQQLGNYLHTSLHHHNRYVIKYLFTELLNFVNTVLNICLLNNIFKDKLISYGTDLPFGHSDSEEWPASPLLLFPRLAMCNFETLGRSGSTERHTFMCVFPYSVFNEKLYLFLWVWMWVLLTGTVLALLWDCLVFCMSGMRRRMLTTYVHDLNTNDIQHLSANLQAGDFFLLYLLQKNASIVAFGDLVRILADRMTKKGRNNPEKEEMVPLETGLRYRE